MPPLRTISSSTRTFTTVFSTTLTILYLSSYNYHPVHGSSMSPALSPSYAATHHHDSVLVTRYTWSPFGTIHNSLARGDVVALRKPTNPDEIAIKRIVGLPGDRVLRTRPQLEKNAKMARKFGLAEVPSDVFVPDGHVWVEGDNWRDSFDSNDYGSVPINLITGRATRIVLPWSRFGPVPDRDLGEGGRTRVIEGRGIDESWKEVYNYDLR